MLGRLGLYIYVVNVCVCVWGGGGGGTETETEKGWMSVCNLCSNTVNSFSFLKWCLKERDRCLKD